MNKNRKIIWGIVIVIIVTSLGWIFMRPVFQSVCWPYCPNMTDKDRDLIKQQVQDVHTTSTSTVDWKTYTNEDLGFTIMYPQGWTIKDMSRTYNFLNLWISGPVRSDFQGYKGLPVYYFFGVNDSQGAKNVNVDFGCFGTTDKTKYPPQSPCNAPIKLSESNISTEHVVAQQILSTLKFTRATSINNSTKSSIIVLSPNGGEIIKMGSIFTIKWTASELNTSKVSIDLIDSSRTCAPMIVGCQSIFNLGYNLDNLGSFLWDTNKKMSGPSTGPNSISVVPGAKYRISVCSDTDSECKVSDKYFTIIN